MFYIYTITNTINNKVYVGRTKNPRVRLLQHISASKKYKHESKLYRAINKYGSAVFEFSIIAGTDQQAISFELESAYIQTLNTIESGYNIALGGGGCGRHSPETRAKMSSTRRANPDLYRTWLNKKQSDETCNKRSRTMKRIGHRPPPLSDEQRMRIGKANGDRTRGKKREDFRAHTTRPVFVNGFLYDSLKLAAKVEGLVYETMRARIARGSKKGHMSIQWLI